MKAKIITLDNAAAAVGPLVAELTGAAIVARVATIETLAGRSAVVVRRLERGYRERVQVELPAVWTVTQDAAQPQYVSSARLTRARREEIPVWRPEQQESEAAVPLWPEAEKTIAPRARVKKKFIPDASISGTDRMKMMMGDVGSQSESSGEDTILDGDPDHLAEQLFRFLKHHDFV